MKNTCKTLLLTLLLALPLGGVSTRLSAQNNSDHIAVGIGAMYKNTLDATISYEHETKYHNSWEYFVNTSLKYTDCEDCGHICNKSFWRNYDTVGGGVCYKPCVSRGRNHHANIRVGASANYASDDSFVTGLHLAYEHSYALRSGVALFWQVKCDGLINGQDKFRAGIGFGIKLPCKR